MASGVGSSAAQPVTRTKAVIKASFFIYILLGLAAHKWTASSSTTGGAARTSIWRYPAARSPCGRAGPTPTQKTHPCSIYYEIGRSFPRRSVKNFDGISWAPGVNNNRLGSKELIIGVNLGKVSVDRHDVYCDGVNVAERLESLAVPGGICVSRSVYTAVGNKLPPDYEFKDE
ncbi:MAG: adenylate/guanylate cyclase domain-containing protein [Pseudomonadales bacterium]